MLKAFHSRFHHSNVFNYIMNESSRKSLNAVSTPWPIRHGRIGTSCTVSRTGHNSEPITGLPQYKDVVLPVKEFPLQT